MNISKAIIGLFLIWISQTATIHSSAVQVDPIASNLSSLFHSRVKRGGYEMKCKQSATGMFSCIKCINSQFQNSLAGMFSFFVVPIIMADIMIDFMGMINVMVDIMATATGTGNGGNNNCNNK